MTDVAIAPSGATTAAGPRGRIVGIDVARALAMLGMVIVHYARVDGTEGALETVAEAMRGRAMPLFMLLGGVGVTLVSRRSPHPDRGLLIRAGLLLVMGLVLHETTIGIAIVLQSYGLFFAVAPLFRRMSSPLLVASAAVVAVTGSITYQLVGTPRRATPYDELFDQPDGLVSLIFDGYYPFFPVAGFFLFGMWLGRLDLRQERLAGMMAGVGTVVGVGAVWLADRLVEAFDVSPAVFGVGGADDVRPFAWARLLDHSGHSEMLAWVVSTAGTSVAVLGLSILLAPRLRPWIDPVAALGSLALTFYIFQGLMTQVLPRPSTTTLTEEFVLVGYLYVGFMIYAWIWKQWFRSGPFEALLRVGSGRSDARGSLAHRVQRRLTSAGSA